MASSGMDPTRRALNRATLRRQLLLGREPLDVVDAVRRIVAVQAQEPASPYVALWNRVAGFEPADLDAAFATGAVVKAPLMRITLHAVAADDYPSFHEAVTSTLRAARLNDRRFRETGLTIADADALVPGLVEFAAAPRTKDEIAGHLRTALHAEPHPNLWWALRTFAPLLHAPTGPPWSFGRRPSFVAAPDRTTRPAPEDARRRLITRYLEGFGPATVADFAQFTLTKISVARAAFEELRPELIASTDDDGRELFDVTTAPEPPADDHPAPPRLLAMWDSVLLAYSDRSRVIPEAHRADVIRRNGDVLPTVLVDGTVAGVWRPVDDGIEVTAFEPFDDATWAALDAEARSLRTFLADRDPDAYRRYGRWWAKLPDGGRRVLAVT